jgi:hypothetical protein
MLNQNAKQWVSALRSGEFKQARGALRGKDGYCCLGVACVVAERDGVSLEADWDDMGYLLENVQAWLGLRTKSGALFVGDSLARLNDSGQSFVEIADVIESEPEGLFFEVAHETQA